MPPFPHRGRRPVVKNGLAGGVVLPVLLLLLLRDVARRNAAVQQGHLDLAGLREGIVFRLDVSFDTSVVNPCHLSTSIAV